ncbi:type II CRISPR RNA-guided endonuclease Cas9 [uncultured Devosia sp.]|uniref:type II CRISPR RNA-guided endonuclease Cas9 n=1 Tax=uncultured Devosia sp. TaxID=211434 RepID=UPI0035CB13D4
MANSAKALFAFDIGTNSIGWSVLDLEGDSPSRIIDGGVRIFSDGREPKSGTSLAEGRRVARGMSRRRERYKRRRKALLRTLVEYGLMPDDPAARKALVAETNDRRADQIASDVYALRARALDEKLPLPHLGRALFHLNQRRGFKSNRKTDRKDNDQGKIAAGISQLGAEMGKVGARTLGEFLYQRRLGGDWVRVRPSRMAGRDEGKAEEGYGFYPERSFLRAEFDAIWDAQADHYPDVLTQERREHLAAVIFHQRPLKKPRVGKCSFNPDEARVAKAHPLFQEFRLYKELNELEIVHRDERHEKLTPEQRDMLFGILKSQRSSQMSAIRKALKAPLGARLNKEREARDKLLGDEVAAEMSAKERFGQAWFEMPLDERWAVIAMLIEEDDPLGVTAWLEERYGFASERIDAIASARLPAGHGRLGPTALAAMLEELRDGTASEDGTGRTVVLTERQALEAVWGDNPAVTSAVRDLHTLPKYQEVLARRIPPGSEEPDDPYDVRKGRISNPTVHIGLNQLQKVLNGLIRRYGRPQEIAIELARELKLSEEQKAEKNRDIARNTRDAQMRSEQLRNLGHTDNGYNRVLLKLWEELDANVLNRVCIYCGKAIGVETLFSKAVDIDHILPWSQTLDDSQANRLVCHVECNRQKANHAPAAVPQWHERYDEILERANRLPLNKRWRFGRDAMKKFKDEESFLARQLTDTQYLSRLAHEYVAALFPHEEPDEWGVFAKKNHVRIIAGRMTEMLRRQWGLNSIIKEGIAQDEERRDDETDAEWKERRKKLKNRNDHRHHAIDAAVVGVTSRALLQRIATAAGGREASGLEDTIRDLPPPWEGFRGDLKAVIDRIVVSHKSDHGTLPRAGQMGQTAGALHNDTAYGLTGQSDARGTPIVVRRKPFLSLTEKDIPAIRDRQLAEALHAAIAGLSGKELAAALDRFSQGQAYKNIRHVRMIEVLNVIAISDKEGRAYKAYKGDANYRYDVWELPDGKWVEEILSMYEAHQPDWQSRVHAGNPAARRVLSLHQNDMVAYEHPKNGPTIGRIVKFSSGMVAFAGHKEAGALKARDADAEDNFKYFYKAAGAMKAAKVRQVRVNETGQLFDPGPQDRESRILRKQNCADS